MKDYKLSEIKKICEEHSTDYGRLCGKCPLRNGVCNEIENAPATWEIDEKGYKETVVLTREECDSKVILDEDHFLRVLDNERAQARNETAKEIYFDYEKNIKAMYGAFDVVDAYSILEELKEICEKNGADFNDGVEVEE